MAMKHLPVQGLSTDSLAEDWRTAWVPDVGGNVDAARFLAGGKPLGPVFQSLTVPKPGGRMEVRVLHPGHHARLHLAVEPLRDLVEDRLAEGVFGYRHGATKERYVDAWTRLNDYIQERAKEAAWVVFADVKGFFENVPLERALAAVLDLDESAHVEPLRALFAEWRLAGLTVLPTGYADARLLGNAHLAHVDRRLDVPFARWVDDYRLFVPDGQDPGAVLAKLETALDEAGLALSPEKTKVVAAAEVARRVPGALDAVSERAELERAFMEASEAPAERRRQLRYALARLEHLEDPIAVDFVLEHLTVLPWEAPRFVSYLGCFAGEARVKEGLGLALADAARLRDPWLVSRLVPLAFRTGLDDASFWDLETALPHLGGTPAWGLVLRLLSRFGRRQMIEVACNEPPDPRAALIALRDFGARPTLLAAQEPETAASLAAPAPLPPLASRL